jgi:hypothetical protein
MTAALEGDKASAEALAKKGNLLSGEKALAAVGKCELGAKMTVLQSCELALSMNVPSGLAAAINPETLGRIISAIRNAAEVTMVNMKAEGAMKNTSADAIANMQKLMHKLGLDNVQKMASTQKGSNSKVMEAYSTVIGNVQKMANAQKKANAQKLGLVGAQNIGNAIKETSMGNNPTLGARIPW